MDDLPDDIIRVVLENIDTFPRTQLIICKKWMHNIDITCDYCRQKIDCPLRINGVLDFYTQCDHVLCGKCLLPYCHCCADSRVNGCPLCNQVIHFDCCDFNVCNVHFDWAGKKCPVCK